MNGSPRYGKDGKWMSWIKDGKAYTQLDDEQFEEMDKEEQDIVLKWIRDKLVPRKTPLLIPTSYGLKHLLERGEKGLYMTNNQFKGAMLLCGFKPVDEHEQNWSYGLSKKSPAFKRD